MEQPKKHEESQAHSCYYGTGRRRELDKSRLPLVVSLLAVILAANLLTLVVHYRQENREQEKSAQTETGASEAEAYPAKAPLTAGAENISTSFGMELCPLEEAERRYWELPEGVIVRSVAADSLAAQTGILQGDILIAVDGSAVKSTSDYFAAIEAVKPGDTLLLTVYRCGTHYVLQLTIPSGEQTVIPGS